MFIRQDAEMPWTSHRAAFVREATRFKPTRSALDVCSRNAEVIERAVAGAVEANLPQVVVRSVFTAVINSSVASEECVVSLEFA